MNSIVKVLVERDGLTEKEAATRVIEARFRVINGEDPEEILMDEFGLEPDYIEDLVF
jgi:hypothetical protein